MNEDTTKQPCNGDVEDEKGSSFSLQLTSAFGSITEARKETDDIKDLQPSQNQRMHAWLAGQSVNQLKRGVVAEWNASKSLPKGTIASNRRTKVLLGEPFKGSDLGRELSHPDETNTACNLHGSVKRLIDLTKDNILSEPVKLKNNPSTPATGTDSHMDLDAETEPEILLQPETRPISHDQLVVEVKSIYVDLITLEAKCIDVDEKHFMKAQEKNSSRQTKLSNEQWRALIVLHKTLLYEHHDFFLISQHSFASSTLNRLAVKYSMLARM